MRVEYTKTAIHIIPESPADEVYLESVLNLRVANQTAEARRVPPFDLPSCWAYLSITATKQQVAA